MFVLFCVLFVCKCVPGGNAIAVNKYIISYHISRTCLLSVAGCFQEMAVLSSTTACAPITSHTTTPGSVPNIATCVIDQATVNTGSATGQQTPAHEKPANKLAEKLHGLTEKLHSLGHYRTDSDTSTRTRTGRPYHSW